MDGVGRGPGGNGAHEIREPVRGKRDRTRGEERDVTRVCRGFRDDFQGRVVSGEEDKEWS